MASDDVASDLVELRPAPSVLLRHRDADLDVVTAPRSGPRVELRRGALWIRAGEDGPGVTVTHGASSVQVRAGAGVVEVLDMEALLVVASGRAAVKGVSPLPRSVIAGQAVTLTLDGTFTDPDALSAAELAADRMVVENLALDNLAGAAPAAPSAPGPAPAPAPVPRMATAPPVAPEPPDTAGEARVDPPGAPQVEPTEDPFAPRVRPEDEAEVEVETPPPTPEPAPAPPVGRPAPSLPRAEPSALETALFGVGVTDVPLEPGGIRTPVTPPPPEPLADDAGPTGPPAGKAPKAKREPKTPKQPKAPKEPRAKRATTSGTPPSGDDRRRQRILVGLVIGAVLILAIVAALAFGTDSASALSVVGLPLVARRLVL